MATKFIESGSNATFGLEFYQSTSGTVASDTGQSFTGNRSIKFSTGGANTLAHLGMSGVMADSGTRMSWRTIFDNLPTTAGANIINITQTGFGLNNFSIGINTNGTMYVNSASGTTNGTTVLAINTKYRISFAYFITNSTTYGINLYINGNLELSRSTGTLTAITSADMDFRFGTPWGANRNLWIGDIYIDNLASSSSLTDTGDIHVTAKLPFSNGTTNGFTGSGTPSAYGTGNARYVNERPLNTTNFVSVLAAGVTTEEYNIENAAVGDVNLNGQSIIDYAGWVHAKAALSETASLILNGNTSSVALTSTNTLFTAFAGSKIYPAGTGADIGITTTGLATTVTLNECGILVAYKYPGYFF